LLNNSVKASDFDCSGKLSAKSNTNTELGVTSLVSSLDKVVAMPTIKNKPINENRIKDTKVAKTILKKLFMFMIDIKKNNSLK
jgi:hypothetical protein